MRRSEGGSVSGDVIPQYLGGSLLYTGITRCITDMILFSLAVVARRYPGIMAAPRGCVSNKYQYLELDNVLPSGVQMAKHHDRLVHPPTHQIPMKLDTSATSIGELHPAPYSYAVGLGI